MPEHRLNRIRMVSLRVRDMRTSEQWYAEKLGLRVVWRNEATTGLQARHPEGAFVVLVQADDPSRFEPETAVHFTTDAIRQVYEQIRASGAADVEDMQTAGAATAFLYRDRHGSPTMVWDEFDPVERSDEIAALLTRFAPVFA